MPNRRPRNEPRAQILKQADPNMNEFEKEGLGLNRRDFLRGGSVATLMTMLGGVELISQAAAAPAGGDIKFIGDPLKVAVIGLGGWGRELVSTLAKLPEANVAAICDNYPAFLKRT